ncbi:MAG: hypothetical protein WEA54_03435 [Actinomycetota bacterium]
MTSAIPTEVTITRDGKAATRMNPVTNVPTSAPAVPSAERNPTTLPVLSRSRIRSFATVGVTELSTAAGAKKANAANTTLANGPLPVTPGPIVSTSTPDSSASPPPSVSARPRSFSGMTRSASLPPYQLPTAIPARQTPITAV